VRLLTALDDGQLRDCDLVALALAVDQSSFKADVTGKSRSEQRRRSSASSQGDTPRRTTSDADRRIHDTGPTASTQVIRR